MALQREDPDHPEKFTDTNGREVDLLPFGNHSEDGKTITWPADDSPWTITDIQEAYDHALLVQLADIQLRIIHPCAMICLKMIATYDRPQDCKRKDTADIQFILEHYLDVAGRERLRSSGSDADAMEKEHGDLQHATARLAGRDVGRIVSLQTAEAQSEILRKETEGSSRCPIARELAGYYQGQFNRARTILTSLRDGFDEHRP